MKILLLGEYSGVHTMLKSALVKLGHDVTLASDGDSFKNFEREIDLKGYGKNIYTRTLSRIVAEYTAVEKIKGYDVVQIINPLLFSQFTPERAFFKKIKSNNGKTFLTALGDDYYYWKAYRDGKFKFTPITDFLKYDVKATKSNWEYGRLKALSQYLAKEVNAVIPCAYTYHLGYKDLADVRHTEVIPFPIDLDRYKFDLIEKQNGSKLKFFHGIQSKRMGFKGTGYIQEAMKRIVADYGERMIYSEVENIPHAEYTSILNNSDIILDQTNGYEPAMNALISMAKGKIVMGGCKREWKNFLGIDYEPLVDISPDPDDIYRRAEEMILNPLQVNQISINARRFVDDFHDSIKVANKFLNVWNNY
jgi:hypothetical protein